MKYQILLCKDKLARKWVNFQLPRILFLMWIWIDFQVCQITEQSRLCVCVCVLLHFRWPLWMIIFTWFLRKSPTSSYLFPWGLNSENPGWLSVLTALGIIIGMALVFSGQRPWPILKVRIRIICHFVFLIACLNSEFNLVCKRLFYLDALVFYKKKMKAIPSFDKA